MRYRCHVGDIGNLETGIVQCTHGGLATRTRTLDLDLEVLHAVFLDDLADTLGSHLGRSVDSYNRAVGSFDSRVLPGARKFREMGVTSKKDVETLSPVEQTPRAPAPAFDASERAPAGGADDPAVADEFGEGAAPADRPALP